MANSDSIEATPHARNNSVLFLDINSTSHNDNESGLAQDSKISSRSKHPEAIPIDGNNLIAIPHPGFDEALNLLSIAAGEQNASDTMYSRPERAFILAFRPLFVYRLFEEEKRQEAEKRKFQQKKLSEKSYYKANNFNI